MTCGGSSIVIDGEEEREDFKAMELYLESPFNVDVDIMPPSEVEKIFRAFAEERKRALPQFTPDGIPITLENKFDDAIYHYLYAYWKEQSGEYDPKDDEIIMTKENSFTKNEKKFEQWLLQQYGMTKKEQREYTLKGNLDSLWEIFSAADMVLLARGLPSIGKELAQLGKKAVDDVTEEVVEKTVQKEAAEEMAESTAKKEVADTAEDLSQKTINKNDVLENSRRSESLKERYPHWYDANGNYTGGRTQEALDALAFDPHKGKITRGSIEEREVILALEEQGYLEYAIRDTWGKGDFYDDIMLKLYDIKSFESFPLDNLGKPITSVNGGAFDVNKAMRNIMKEFEKNGVDYVIINSTKMDPLHISQLKKQIELKGVSDLIIWY